MVHIIYICIITFLLGAYLGRYKAYKSLESDMEQLQEATEERVDYWYNRQEAYRLQVEDLKEKGSVKAYLALEQGLTETQDAYATDMAQYEDSLRILHESMQAELTETYRAIRNKVEEDKQIADLQKFVDANTQA